MANFVLLYYGEPKFSSEEEGKAHQGKWMEWMQAMGDTMVNPGTPMGPAKSVTSNSVTDSNGTRLTGFSIVKADDMDAAIEIAKSCPFVAVGTVDVAEAFQM